jgi:hypothetical protein
MTQINPQAPHSEWVQMYRQGISSSKVAADAGVAETMVRYHLAIAAKQEPTLRAEHKAALPLAPRVTDSGRKTWRKSWRFTRPRGGCLLPDVRSESPL